MWKAEEKIANLHVNYRGNNENLDASFEYGSKDGMQSAIFGPAYWMSIHITSFNYPVTPSLEDKKNYKNWLLSIGNVLPCRYCRENFTKNLESAGFNDSCMNNRDSFSRFCYNLHDCVNNMLGKSSPSFETIRDKYEVLRAKCLTDEQKEELSKSNKELGCIRPLHKGERGKCVITIVPQNSEVENFNIDKKCMPN